MDWRGGWTEEEDQDDENALEMVMKTKFAGDGEQGKEARDKPTVLI